MKKYRVGVIGCTGMVGQRFITLIDQHPWFELQTVAASSRSAGMTYEEAVGKRWKLEDAEMPESVRKMTVLDATKDIEKIASQVDFVFSAVDMKKEEIQALEEEYAKHECPVVSNNSAHRWTPDVPMIIPEVNPEHLEVIHDQRKRLGTEHGFIAVKSNCSIQTYVPALSPFLKQYPIEKILVCTYQAISGAGKTFESWPEMIDNVIPYIGGEEEKSEREPLKVWGHVEGGRIVDGCGVCEIPRCKTQSGRNDSDLGRIQRSSAAAEPSLCPRAVPALFHGRKSPSDRSRPDARQWDDRVHRPAAGRFSV